jgi:hypothetical protein
MIDERQFQIGGSCTYHTTTTIDMINISLAENANYIALLKCRLSISKIAYAIQLRIGMALLLPVI